MGRLTLHILADSGQRVYCSKCSFQAIYETFPPLLHIGASLYPVSLNQRVLGSSPSAPTKFSKRLAGIAKERNWSV